MPIRNRIRNWFRIGVQILQEKDSKTKQHVKYIFNQRINIETEFIFNWWFDI